MIPYLPSCLRSQKLAAAVAAQGFTAAQTQFLDGYSQLRSSDNWNFSGAMRYSFEAITTIGYGAYSPQSSGAQAFVVFYAALGLGIVGLQFGTFTEAMVVVMERCFDVLCRVLGRRDCSPIHYRRVMHAVERVFDNFAEMCDDYENVFSPGALRNWMESAEQGAACGLCSPARKRVSHGWGAGCGVAGVREGGRGSKLVMTPRQWLWGRQ